MSRVVSEKPSVDQIPAKRRKVLNHEGRWGLFMVSPYLLHFIIFVAGPLAASLYFSFSEYDMLNPPDWNGLENYNRLFGDPLFWKSLRNTLYFAVLFVPLQTLLALILAVVLNQKLKGLKWFRMAHFIPVISSWTVILYVADAIFNPRFGFANAILNWFGFQPQRWLQDADFAIPLLVLIAVWKGIGYIMVIYLAGLQSVPGDLYEAAEIDGAGVFRKFTHITMPMISATTFLVVILSTISTFQAFEQIYVLTGGGEISSAGGPENSTLVLMLYLYREGFTYLRMGYASALSWVLFMILFVLTLIQLRLQKRWVHYD